MSDPEVQAHNTATREVRTYNTETWEVQTQNTETREVQTHNNETREVQTHNISVLAPRREAHSPAMSSLSAAKAEFQGHTDIMED